LTPRPRPVRELAAELVWVAMAASMARAFTDGIDADSAELEAGLAEAEARELEAAAEAGRAAVLATVEAELQAAESVHASSAATRDPAVAAEARRRLDRCAELLAAERARELDGCSARPDRATTTVVAGRR